ncbi:MAG: 4Fe-4S dicluster domain-containing protein, partial [Candidatus Coatesbacteria bacterium]
MFLTAPEATVFYRTVTTPNPNPLLEAWRENLARCLRCGLCREVCPAFRATGRERLSPRGRLALLEASL